MNLDKLKTKCIKFKEWYEDEILELAQNYVLNMIDEEVKPPIDHEKITYWVGKIETIDRVIKLIEESET